MALLLLWGIATGMVAPTIQAARRPLPVEGLWAQALAHGAIQVAWAQSASDGTPEARIAAFLDRLADLPDGAALARQLAALPNPVAALRALLAGPSMSDVGLPAPHSVAATPTSTGTPPLRVAHPDALLGFTPTALRLAVPVAIVGAARGAAGREGPRWPRLQPRAP